MNKRNQELREMARNGHYKQFRRNITSAELMAGISALAENTRPADGNTP